MALEELIARLERDASARIAALQKKTAAEVAALHQQAAHVRAAEEARLLEVAREQRKVRFERERAAARQRSRAERLAAQHRLLEQVFERAAQKFDELGRTAPYARALAAQVKADLRFLEGLAVEVRCRPALAEALRQALAGTPRLTVVEDAAAPVGAELESGDGKLKVDETLAGRLERARARLCVTVIAEVRT